MHCFVFDIETIPDIELGRRLYDLDGLSDRDVATALAFRRQQETGSEFLPLHMHRIVAISGVLRRADKLQVWSLGDAAANEAEIVARFFDGIEKLAPVLVSWNGGGFDLPVLHYRALRHGVCAPRYWEVGDQDTQYRYNNYLSRFHWRHIDLMDVLAGFQPRARASLDHVATMLGFPGKLGMRGDQVWDTWLAGDIGAIRDYCETDVLNTYLVYLRFELMRGRLDQRALTAELALVRDMLAETDKPHLSEFLAAWQR